MDQENRVVVLIDMDCFYCQVEEKLDPELKGKPIAVVQYNPWKGGGIIAVNYVARAMGVTRHMRGDEAKEKCPEIQLPSVPCSRGKADITKYRDAGKEVARVLQKFTPLLERASIDEAYLDITAAVQERLKTLNPHSISTEHIPNTYALGYDNVEDFISDVRGCSSDSIEFDYDHARRLLVGAAVVSEIRAAVYDETGYRCSAGIAHNKILAKLVCGMHKPDKQTVLPKHTVHMLYRTLSIKKVKHLGGKFGDTVCETLKITNMADLERFTEKELQARFDEKNGTWLYNITRGIDLDPVQARFNPKSIGCCKQFRGKSALTDLESLKKWLKDLGDEIEDRLEKDSLENNRNPKQMVVSFATQAPDGRDCSSSRSYNFGADDELCGDLFTGKALELVLENLEGSKACATEETNRKLRLPIKFLGISVGKFEDHSDKKTKKILDYFGAGSSNVKNLEASKSKDMTLTKNVKKLEGKEYIMQRFLQAADKSSNSKENESKVKKEDETVNNDTNETQALSNRVIESPLEKQESFFARLLNKNTNSTDKLKDNKVNDQNEIKSSSIRPNTPVCSIAVCGDDSNDTDYSGSTINNEINKSIALFEEDPKDVARVSNMREWLNRTVLDDEGGGDRLVKTEDKMTEINKHQSDSSVKMVEKDAEVNKDQIEDKIDENTVAIGEKLLIETFQCSECGKTLSVLQFETHADYHFALKLREEERQRVRDEHKQKTQSKVPVNKVEIKKIKTEEQSKSPVASMSNFLVKIDDTKPTETCPECGKKIPIDKLAEHSDFHEAQRLSKELNRRPTVLKTVFKENSVKRKRKSTSPLKKPKLSCTSRSIDSFFR